MTPADQQYYKDKFKDAIFVIKIGGEVLNSEANLENILRDIKEIFDLGMRVVLVHGGGMQADNLSEQLGHTPTKVDGRRVTTKKDLEIVKMTYGGSTNLEILSILKKIGTKGIRVSGLDGGLLDVKLRDKTEMDYGFVGDITAVHPQILFDLIEVNSLPIVSPIAVTDDGTIVNINADTIATELAISMQADKLILFTNTEGIYIDGELAHTLTSSEIHQAIDDKKITDGMIVKGKNCVKAVENKVKRVHIVNGLEPHRLIQELMTKDGAGTMIVSDTEKDIYVAE